MPTKAKSAAKSPSRSVRAATLPVVGQIRRFGKFGPAYLIEKITGTTCFIIVPENGQKANLTFAQIMADPIEA